MCLKELRDEFLYDCECRHLAKGSLRNYRASTRFLLEFLERKQITELEDVRPRHLRDLMKEKQDAGNTPRYINDLLKVWRTWFNYLVEEGYLEERDNPAKKVKPLRQPRTIIDTFTAAEMKRMIQFYDGKDFLEVRNKTIIMLLFDTGMRCNEMILMEPEDIKPDYILVKHGKGGACGTEISGIVQAAHQILCAPGWLPERMPHLSQKPFPQQNRQAPHG